jgi:hypothetical protein
MKSKYKNNKKSTEKIKIVCVETLDWSYSAGGEHYYATMKTMKTMKTNNAKNANIEERIELEKTLTAKEANYLNKKDGCDPEFYEYKAGDKTNRFSSIEDVTAEALKLCKEKFPDVKLILHGSYINGSVNQALHGNPQIVKKINELYEEADLLDFYSGKDDERMEKIDEEYAKIIKKIIES